MTFEPPPCPPPACATVTDRAINPTIAIMHETALGLAIVALLDVSVSEVGTRRSPFIAALPCTSTMRATPVRGALPDNLESRSGSRRRQCGETQTADAGSRWIAERRLRRGIISAKGSALSIEEKTRWRVFPETSALVRMR